MTMRVAYKTIDSKMATREKVLRAMSEFASQLPRDSIINISQAEDRDNIAVTVWYWTDEAEDKFEFKGRKQTMSGAKEGKPDEAPKPASAPAVVAAEPASVQPGQAVSQKTPGEAKPGPSSESTQ